MTIKAVKPHAKRMRRNYPKHCSCYAWSWDVNRGKSTHAVRSERERKRIIVRYTRHFLAKLAREEIDEVI